MAGFQVLTTADIDCLRKELDIFSGKREPVSELILKGLYPPLPICSDTLIWGFDILRAAEGQSLRRLNCLILPACPPPEMLALALKLENRAGSFGWPEKEKMLHFLAASAGLLEEQPGQPEGVPAEAAQAARSLPAVAPRLIDPLRELSPLIENHRDPQLAAKIAAFASLPRRIKDLVAQGQIDLKSAARVQGLPEEVFARLGESSLSFSQRRQFLQELFEVSRKRKLSGQGITDLAIEALRHPQPLETIHRLRFPTLTALEQRFSALERELLKGSGVRLRPPPYYEGDAFTVEFEFNSPKTLARKLNALHSLEGRLDALFELLH